MGGRFREQIGNGKVKWKPQKEIWQKIERQSSEHKEDIKAQCSSEQPAITIFLRPPLRALSP